MLIPRPQQRSMPMESEGGCADMNEFVGMLFLARTLAHNAHLSTTSFAQHKTLDDFYNGIVPLADSIAQKWMGRTKQVLKPCVCEDEFSGDFPSQLDQLLDCIEACRYNVVDRNDSALQNVIDEIVGFFLDTRYQLTLK